MESTIGTTSERRRDAAPERERPASLDARPWLQSKSKLLDEQAFLIALGRGGAQRMAIPLGSG